MINKRKITPAGAALPKTCQGKIFFIGILTLLIGTSVQAQKQPVKQGASVKVPANIKIDGKLNEWGDLKAYNNATDLYYTLANDNQNLYLAVKVGSKATRAKVFGAGISLIFKNTVITDKGASITFMGFPKDNRFEIDELLKDTIANDLRKINAAITSALKNIPVKNLDGVSGDVIPVYNEYGITAAAYLGSGGFYTCEIAIPLKYLKSFINSLSAINYTLQANAQTLNHMKVVVNGKIVENGNFNTSTAQLFKSLEESEQSSGLRELMSDTNVSGEYTLAK